MKICKAFLLSVTALLLSVLCGCGDDHAAQKTWTQLTPSGSPPARYAHAMALAKGGPLLFGGRTSDGISGMMLDDTWAWDGSRWLQLSPAEAPSARMGHAMTYDEARQEVVLFGGTTSLAGDAAPSGLMNETWTWDGSNWELKFVGEVLPPARWLHSMDYDPIRRRVVLFGGQVSEGTWLNDTWEWNGTRWMQVLTPVGSPPPLRRYGHAMAYDDYNQRTLLFGGASEERVTGSADTFWWEGVDWDDVRDDVTLAVLPPARRLHAMASDPDERRVILFGGRGKDAALADTWIWDRRQWFDARTPASPPSRSDHAMTFQPATSEILLFGGRSATGLSMNDTWVFGNSR